MITFYFREIFLMPVILFTEMIKGRGREKGLRSSVHPKAADRKRGTGQPTEAAPAVPTPRTVTSHTWETWTPR